MISLNVQFVPMRKLKLSPDSISISNEYHESATRAALLFRAPLTELCRRYRMEAVSSMTVIRILPSYGIVNEVADPGLVKVRSLPVVRATALAWPRTVSGLIVKFHYNNILIQCQD